MDSTISAANEQEDDCRLPLLGQVEAEASGGSEPSTDGGPCKDDEEERCQQIEVYRDRADAGISEDRLGKLRPCGVAEDEHDVAGREGEEAPEDEEVRKARAVVADRDPLKDLALSEYERDGPENASRGLVESVGWAVRGVSGGRRGDRVPSLPCRRLPGRRHRAPPMSE